MADPQRFTTGQTIFAERDTADTAFLVITGSVELLRKAVQGEVQLAVLEKGDAFGESALFEPGGPRPYTAKAVNDCEVVRVDRQQMENGLAQCPPLVADMLRALLDKQSLSTPMGNTKGDGELLLENDIGKVTVHPKDGSSEFTPMPVNLARLPFVIGGFERGDETTRNRRNHLNIASDGPPLIVSRSHCQIEINDGALYLSDLGSRFTTLVNGLHIGRGKGVYQAPLKKGRNEIVMGGPDSPYQVNIDCE